MKKTIALTVLTLLCAAFAFADEKPKEITIGKNDVPFYYSNTHYYPLLNENLKFAQDESVIDFSDLVCVDKTALKNNKGDLNKVEKTVADGIKRFTGMKITLQFGLSYEKKTDRPHLSIKTVIGTAAIQDLPKMKIKAVENTVPSGNGKELNVVEIDLTVDEPGKICKRGVSVATDKNPVVYKSVPLKTLISYNAG